VIGQILDRLSRLEDQFRAHEEVISGQGKTPQGAVLKDEQIYSLLKDVIDPGVGMDIVKLGLVKEVIVDGPNVDVNLVLTTSSCPMIEYFKEQVRRKVLSAGGIEKVNVNILDEPWSWDRFKKQVVR
jgi:serine O-acetyltransferase